MKKHSCVEDIQRIKYYLSFMYHTNRIAYMFLYFSKESLQLYAYSYMYGMYVTCTVKTVL